MTLLAVDTSHAKGTLALGGHQVMWAKQAMHSEVATLELQKILIQCGLKLKDLTHLAVNVGPGSFTGLRVGISMVRALAYSLDLPVACLNSLELIGHKTLKAGERGVVAIPAIQNFYYAAAYEKKTQLVTLAEPQSVEDLDKFASALSCTKVLLDECTEARDLAQMLVELGDAGRFFSWQAVKPLYVRASEAEEKLKKGIIL